MLYELQPAEDDAVKVSTESVARGGATAPVETAFCQARAHIQASKKRFQAYRSPFLHEVSVATVTENQESESAGRVTATRIRCTEIGGLGACR